VGEEAVADAVPAVVAKHPHPDLPATRFFSLNGGRDEEDAD